MTKSPPFTRRDPLLRSLHWLPVQFRILLNMSLLTYKRLHEKQPLHSILAASRPSCSLIISKWINLSVLRVKTIAGAKAFHSCAPALLNNLSLSVVWAILGAICKKHLKTHLFDLAIPPLTLAHPPAHWCHGTVSSILLWNTKWLFRHWAWLCREYRRYRNLIDWMIDR